ncbi:MAG TPA: RNA polymerase-associated protein RapA, partial [Gammaproteobacteria bacterium]|nr:RNA polymerase-associated protein RapA [Gammaproteobacteria bacterium]
MNGTASGSLMQVWCQIYDSYQGPAGQNRGIALPYAPFAQCCVRQENRPMQDIAPGQRWISDTELDMGLGTVLAVEQRSISIAFPATGEQRTYARQTAPLTRVAFAPGDTIQNQQGESLRVSAVEEVDGLLFYRGVTRGGEHTVWPEGQLDHHLQLNRPRERLLAGQLDAHKWFELRYQSLGHSNRLAHSDLYGLIGARTSLIPHQLFIAHEVARRYAPRVLLADEVGLGKTIEAGLILHQQLLTERARRVLIVVPEALVHQWLVEMLRRFNLRFSVFDEERCQGIEETSSGEATGDNPFDSEQLILCSLDFLTRNSRRSEQALASQWDFLVVDEAHHLQWSPARSSDEYRFIEAMAQQTKGVLLLTATPEQLGKESHFARLRLLDPERFPDFAAFVEEEAHYQPVAEAVEALLQAQHEPVPPATLATLRETLTEAENQVLIDALDGDDREAAAQARQQLIQRLLDRHGTGRVLFRNTRATVKGFPAREVRPYPLPLPHAYAEACARVRAAADEPTPDMARQLLCPERLLDRATTPWTDIDPRIPWLLDTLQRLRPQ